MFSIEDCQQLVETQISQLNLGPKQPTELYEPIAYILKLGGKRIRPVLTLMACNLFSDDISLAIPPALSIEVFHNFTLVHDDIMDNAPLRRGQPTVHAKWNNNIAILSGDAMQILAYRLLSACESDNKHLILQVFNSTAIEVCEGQQYDMNFAMQSTVSLSDYIWMIELKTSVLVAASLKIGALCGNASIGDAQKLYDFGRYLGLAFQIQDDYLDVFANQDLFGKSVGGDIAENKKTFLLIKALELAKGNHAVTLQRAINNEITDVQEKIALVKEIYSALKISEITNEKILEYSGLAFNCLESVNIADSRKENLLKMAQTLIKREK